MRGVIESQVYIELTLTFLAKTAWIKWIVFITHIVGRVCADYVDV